MEKTAIIMCGGQGSRLRPYTITIPKPLMPLGDGAILEIIVKQLEKYCFDKLILAVNYRSDLIKAYFQNGEKFGISIEYVDEVEPLGTIAPLRNVKNLPDQFLVMNGDILTDLNFDYYFRKFNAESECALVPVYRKNYKVDFGVLQINENSHLESFQEKPEKELLVSMGVYFFSSKIIDLIPKSGSFGFDQLMLLALEKNLKVLCPEHNGYWLDIGRHEDYMYAQDNFQQLIKSL
ncbi:MAG: sugar phosphate nucleotidyltransferase [Gammaproteobacteria bacterium]